MGVNMLTPSCLGAGSSVPQEILSHVTDMVEDGCRVCRRVQAEGIQVLSLITRDPHSLTQVATAQEREKWAAAVRVSLLLALLPYDAVRVSPLLALLPYDAVTLGVLLALLPYDAVAQGKHVCVTFCSCFCPCLLRNLH